MLPLVIIFNLLTWDNNEGEFVVIGGVKESEGVFADTNFLLWSSFDFEKNEGERLRLTVAEVLKWWWSSKDGIRATAAEDVSLTSRDETAAAAARKYGFDKAAAAAIAAWFESTS